MYWRVPWNSETPSFRSVKLTKIFWRKDERAEIYPPVFANAFLSFVRDSPAFWSRRVVRTNSPVYLTNGQENSRTRWNRLSALFPREWTRNNVLAGKLCARKPYGIDGKSIHTRMHADARGRAGQSSSRIIPRGFLFAEIAQIRNCKLALLPRAITEVYNSFCVKYAMRGHSSALPIIPCHTRVGHWWSSTARERRGVGTW